MQKELVCVNCPKGCRIKVTLENQTVTDIQGYSCEKGRDYAAQETIRPMRILTTTIAIRGGTCHVLPVITDHEIPLDQMEQAMAEVRKLHIEAPIHMNDVIVHDFITPGVNLVASRSMAKQSR